MTGRFECQATPLGGLIVLQRKPLGDQRGYLERLFCHEELKPLLGEKVIRQINHTLTAKQGTIRGMHFQYPPFAEAKIVSCLRGEVFDVAVDLRRDSSTFLQWYGEVLSATNHKTLLIPEGFAHGFQTLTDDCEMLYCHTQDYHSQAEGGLNALDPNLAITWSLPVIEQSLRDQQHSLLTNNNFQGIVL
jgi:dTDP-4-dehydrorhamnose 3,5-epimerase